MNIEIVVCDNCGARYYTTDESEWRSKLMHRVCDTCFMPMEVKNPFYRKETK